MRHLRLQVTATLLGLLCATVAPAQQSQPITAATTGDPTITPGPIIGGMGTKNFIPIWATPNFLLSSVIYQASGGNVGIGTQTPGSKLDVAGDVNLSGGVRYQGSPMLQLPGGVASGNIALGIGALAGNITGYNNTGIGFSALQTNTTGAGNTASGHVALGSNTDGEGNTAMGDGALGLNNSGSYNAAVGYAALFRNTTGGDNAATGNSALGNNTTGNSNTASGDTALYSNTTGTNNIAIGVLSALNVAGGNSNNIHIGSQGSAGDSGTIRVGDPSTQTSFFAAGIRGVTTANHDAVPVMIDSAGQLGTVSSSRRFKEDIADMGAASRDLMRLRPVTFRYKEPFADGSKPIQFGLIAEEVDEVYPDLVAHSADGQIETVKYQVLDSMLLNELQRQQAEIGAQKDQVRRLEQRIKEQDDSFQERLAKLEAALVSMSELPKVGSNQ